MNTVNQNNVLNSIYEALTPGAALIDGRTEQDWLRFLSDFATLINFFDGDNRVNGNWEPFLLKDPVFLTAAISGTGFTKLYTLYLRSCHKLEQLLLPGSNTKDLPISFNQLFDQLIAVFVRIRKWACYMRRSMANYPLKTYVNRQIKTTFANLFQAILSLRQELFSSAIIAGLDPVDPILIAEFDVYEEQIWKEGEFRGPYWELMGLLHPIKKNNLTAIFKALTNAGDTLFNFLKVIIMQADIEFGRLTKLKSSYPDTTLLRTFIHLLRIQQDQLNEIGAKHLTFYYKGILKQTERKALADRAYIVASLTTKDAVFVLPAGTLFDGGTDAQKNPVVFESTEDVVLNPATIPVAYTLSRAPASNELSTLQLQTIPNPGVLQKDAEGKILSWDTFGSAVPEPAIQKSTGIAFASPMLLLREGVRTIKISLEYTGEPDLNMLKQANCYLSTLNDWFQVSADFQLEDSSSHTISITIALQSTDPAIECFLVNPDGMVSSWPMFKLVFEQITAAAVAPPVLHTLKIEVSVSGIETFQLYNDYGALSTKVAFPPFGPAPVNGSNFIIGSNEIFSKPLDSLTLQLKWSALPPDFSVYYQAYNLYLNNQLKLSNTPAPSWWEKIFGKKDTPEPVMQQENDPYNNTCFIVDFQVLEEKTWTTVGFNTLVPAPAEPVDTAAPNLLFTADPAAGDTLNTYSTTAIPLAACDPALQNQPAKFTELSTAGFMKMEMKGPAYGFGSAIYPNVVSAITMYNSQILYNKEDLAFADPAQLPFTPKLTTFSADYTATVQYIFDAGSQDTETLKDYPVQVFSYTPFTNYTIYDNLNQPPAQKYTIGDSGTAEDNASGIPLYTSFNYDGFLYLAIDSLIPASSFNVYFELSRKYVTGSPAENKIGYYYLGTEGWAPLIVISDGTDNLTSSGIVRLNIPEDIALGSNLMPGGSYWIVIVADDISLVAATVLLSTNGIGVQRTGAGASTDTVTAPALAADAITKTKNNMPKIAGVQQPFPSFGGQAAEDVRTMSQRISHRLKTKDRAVTAADYLLLIRQEFKNIYDAVAVFDTAAKTTNVYVVKSVDSWKAPHAFLPMVSISEEEVIQSFLQQRTSAFSIIKVLNPDYQSVSVCAVITIQPGYEFLTVQQQLTQALNMYLSPWIKDAGVQVRIYQEITDVQVAAFIRTITGVATVENVSFKTWIYNPADTDAENAAIPLQTVNTLKKSALFVSNQSHQIILNPAAL